MIENIVNWYEQFGRKELPWRLTSNPYHIYLSEIMLQQTQVKTVLERFYFQFLETFPTLEDLAQASQEEVLKAWEGLGYYTRARNLHKTAQLVQTQLPSSSKALLELPGIGPSTANAIACFAFGEAVPILDGNMKRILYRYFKKEVANEKELWTMVEKLFSKKEAYIFNQAMMDIGSTLCTPRNPKCEQCPLSKKCKGKATPLLYPKKKAKKVTPIRNKMMVIYKKNNQYGLYKSSEKLLGGLWGFKQYEKKEEESLILGHIEHIYSHFKLKAIVVLKEEDEPKVHWFSLKEIEKLPLSKADQKALELLKQYNSNT